MNYSEVRAALIKDATKLRIPILGEFELTARCNLKCEMCYVVHQKAKDLDTQTWMEIFKQAVDAGLVFALLTGGELFLRKDAIHLYNMLYDLGVKITVFTNGTDITDEIADALMKRPPETVTITLYGASNETYHIVTKHPSGFDLVNAGIKKLIDRQIHVMLRTIPLKALYHDLDAMIAFAKEKQLPLHYLRYVGPTRSGCMSPLSMRLSPEKLIDFEMRLNQAFGFNLAPCVLSNTQGLTCAALKSGYFISYEGIMQPCAMANHPAQSIIHQDFKTVFDQLRKELEVIETCDLCASCHHQKSCMQCYARRMLEQNAQSCPPYLKQYAMLKDRGQ